MRTWLGIDFGTSGVKAILVSEDGDVVERGHAEYPSSEVGAAHEQQAADYIHAIRDAISHFETEPDGVGIVGHTPSLVLAAEDATAARPVITWRDGRPTAEAERLRGSFGSSLEVFGVDNLWDVSQLPAKLLWLSSNDPQALASTEWLLTPKDYIGFRLTGAAATDAWSSKGLWSIAEGRPSREVFAAAGVDEALLAPVLDPWEVLGTTTPAAAAEFGLPSGCPVVVGWSDAMGGMLGIGAAALPRGFVLAGTSDIVGRSFAADEATKTGVYRVPASCSPIPIDYGPTQSSGASLLWLSRLTGRTPSELVSAAAGAAETDAVFLPYLRGERAPLWDPSVRASISDIAESDGVAELALATMRGVGLSNRHVLDACGHLGAGEPVHLGGSDVGSPGWSRARSEALGVDLVIHLEPQLPALGAAMLARSGATGEPIAESYRRLGADVRVVRAEAAADAAARRRYSAYRRQVAVATGDFSLDS
ncbi:FGGY-family carbohydrate kinase [Leifsonia shinshuensis]|uniref:xylulokinase n=1 Tax=Leifsonia shinshuensis TaxID=150026 RepID=UPI001F50F104|nr:FGGY-family carbohydrate kinase [Leifsonia shinshuensis]MCI0158803.1 FGGY-family carbohydrate kinase [Leifsonia shinshuensis]